MTSSRMRAFRPRSSEPAGNEGVGRFGERLRALGFREDQREGAPLCRWLVEDLVVDVMPARERVLGFTTDGTAMREHSSARGRSASQSG